MADRHLTELAWKAFSRSKGYKDAAFVKALAEFEKSDKAAAEVQLKALDEVEKQAGALEKGNKADKALAEYIGSVEKAAAKARKEAERLAKEEAAKAEADDEEDDEPALLTTAMIPLLRKVKKGDVVMHVLVAVAGKESAVLLMRRAIAPAKRRLIAEYMGSPGGIKYHKGQCTAGEGGSVLFDMETGGGGGMAKKIRMALLEQTGLRIKVKMRAADTGEEEDDGEDEDAAGDPAEDSGGDSAESGAETVEEGPEQALMRTYDERWASLEPRVLEAVRANGPDSSRIRAVSAFAGEKRESEELAPALKALDTLEGMLASKADIPMNPLAAFKARLAALMPRVQQAIAANGPESSQIKSKVTSAGSAAQRDELDAANALLDEIEESIARTLGIGPGGADPAARWDQRVAEVDRMLQRLLQSDPGVAEKVGKVIAFARGKAAAGQHAQALTALDQAAKMVAAADAAGRSTAGEGGHKGIVKYRGSLLQFNQARDLVKGQLAGLRKAIPAQLPDEADLADELAQTLDDLSEAMQDAVDEAINSLKDPDHPVPKAVADRIAEFEAELQSNELVKHADGNPFGVKVSIGETLGKALKAVRDNMPAPA